MSEWIEKPLGKVTSYLAKGIPPKYTEELSDNAIYVLNQKCNRDFVISYDAARLHDLNQKKVAEEKMVQPGDVLINSTGEGTAGRVAQIWDLPYPTTTDGHMILIRPTAEVDPLYYGYAVKAYQSQIETLAEGSTGQTEINKKRLQDEIIICFPKDKDEQHRVAEVLEKIDKKIAVNNKINRNLADQVSAIYKSWFVDFELYDGVCPDTWKIATLGDLAEVSSGKRPPMKQTDKTDGVTIPLAGAASIMGYTNEVLYDSKILVTGRVGTHGVIQRFNEKCWPSDNTLVITTARYEFVYQILQGIDYTSMNRGSTQPLITQSDLKKTEIIIPTVDVLDKFEALAGGLMEQYEKKRIENIKLTELRDTLLPKLMSGELVVSEIDL